jgi:hypothetical protein
MATFGAAGINQYSLPNYPGFFSNVVNPETKVTQIYLQGSFGTQQSVGTYNHITGKFTPDSNSNLTQQQLSQIASPEGLNVIKNQSIQTATKAGATNATQLLSSNTATSSTSGGQLTSASLIGNLRQQTQDKDVRTSYGDSNTLRYPLDRNPKQDYIKISMLRYSPRSVDPAQSTGSGSGSVFGSRGARSILGSVSLPIQPSISDTNAVVWGEDRMNAFQAKGAMESLNIMAKGAAGTEESMNRTAAAAAENAGALKALVGLELAQKAVGNEAGNFFTRATGAIVNPNLELLFQGPSLRSFTFNFKLSARDEREADAIKKIIRFFKQGMSVKRATTSLFLKSPNTFGISYIYGGTGKDHPWINKVKECALQNFTVNYTPEGNYATYTDGSMTSYDLTMTFSELDPIYDDDYQKLDGNNDQVIGY